MLPTSPTGTSNLLFLSKASLLPPGFGIVACPKSFVLGIHSVAWDLPSGVGGLLSPFFASPSDVRIGLALLLILLPPRLWSLGVLGVVGTAPLAVLGRGGEGGRGGLVRSLPHPFVTSPR